MGLVTTNPKQTPLRPAAIEAWVTADRRLDLETMRAQLADGVVLVSPLTDAFAFRGPEAVIGSSPRPSTSSPTSWLTVGEDGLISRVCLFVRPLPSAAALLARIGPRLHARGVLPRRAGVAARSAVPIVAVLDGVERFVMPRVGPARVHKRDF